MWRAQGSLKNYRCWCKIFNSLHFGQIIFAIPIRKKWHSLFSIHSTKTFSGFPMKLVYCTYINQFFHVATLTLTWGRYGPRITVIHSGPFIQLRRSMRLRLSHFTNFSKRSQNHSHNLTHNTRLNLERLTGIESKGKKQVCITSKFC